MARRSPSASASMRSRARKSALSHTGPTTCHNCFDPARGTTACTSCHASYSAGRSRSFMAAQRERILVRIDRFLVTVADAETSTEIDVLELDPVPRQLIDQREHLRRGREMRVEVDDLRADMHVDAAYFDVGKRSGA